MTVITLRGWLVNVALKLSANEPRYWKVDLCQDLDDLHGKPGAKASPVAGASPVRLPHHRDESSRGAGGRCPAILRKEAEFEGWLTTPVDVALALQQPLPDDARGSMDFAFPPSGRHASRSDS